MSRRQVHFRFEILILLCLNTLREGVVILILLSSIIVINKSRLWNAIDYWCYRAIIKCEIKNAYKGPLSTPLFLMNPDKYVVWAWATGGRRDFNFNFFCHFTRPVAVILNFIAQKNWGRQEMRNWNFIVIGLNRIGRERSMNNTAYEFKWVTQGFPGLNCIVGMLLTCRIDTKCLHMACQCNIFFYFR